MRTSPFAALLLSLALCHPASGQSADRSAASGRPVAIAWELGVAHVDPSQLIGAAFPIFLVPGVEVATRGPVFGYAGVRGMVFMIPISGHADQSVEDSAGNRGHRTHGDLSLLMLRAGVGARVVAGPRPVTLHASGGNFGVGREAKPWVGVGVGVAIRPRVRLGVEVGWNRNYFEDYFPAPPWDDTPAAGQPYSRRTEVWLRRMQIGVRFGG